jgi:hypothetical protein
MTTSDGVSSSGLYGFKNRIINGAMVIDQRNAGASVSVTGDTYCLDRYNMRNNGTSAVYSVQQSSTAPTGFNYSTLCTVTTAGLASGTQFLGLQQSIEGYNMADFGWGTANAQPVTVSFQVRSSLTGTYCVSLRNSAADRSYVAEFTINSANTFETKTITIPAITTGTWLSTNGSGILFLVCLGSGSTREGTANSWQSSNIVATSNQVDWSNTNGATFYITGVQLEKGSTATSFDYRPYGTELQLCQRYYFQLTNSGSTLQYVSGIAFDATNIYTMDLYFLPVPMRTAPTITTTGTLLLGDGLGNNPPVNSITWGSLSLPYFITASLVSSGLTTGRTYFIISGTALKVSAEL